MPRRPRLAAGNLAYHVLNRRVGTRKGVGSLLLTEFEIGRGA